MVNTVKVRVIERFRDKSENLKMRLVGTTLEVTEARAKELDGYVTKVSGQKAEEQKQEEAPAEAKPKAKTAKK